MKIYKLEEWKAKGEWLYGDDYEDWRFICPACGRTNTGKEFRDAGAESDDMYTTCIGRHNGKGVKGIQHKQGSPPPEHGCDWAAYGLFGTLGRGVLIVTPASSQPVEVFAFADDDEVGEE